MTTHRMACRLVLLLFLGCGHDTTAHPDGALVEPFTCGMATCDATTQFCYTFSAGVAPTIGCNALPPTCMGARTCACVMASFDPTQCASSLSCTDDHGQVQVTCTGI